MYALEIQAKDGKRLVTDNDGCARLFNHKSDARQARDTEKELPHFANSGVPIKVVTVNVKIKVV